MNYILVDVDTQNAFAHPDGNLTVWNSEMTPEILDNIKDLVNTAQDKHIPIIGSVDSHSYDSWEFSENGGPFPKHAIKGTFDWLKIDGTLSEKFRFLPMSGSQPYIYIGENKKGYGNRLYNSDTFAFEAQNGIGLYFEKEVYSAFSNDLASCYIDRLVYRMGRRENVTFLVMGFCLGGFCVDEFAKGLLSARYNVQIILDACQAIDGVNAPDGLKYSCEILSQQGAVITSTSDILSIMKNLS
jgi:nicotinamidase/pyrazinamidase